MPTMNNHGYYVSFKRTDEEKQLLNISEENRILKSKLDDLQEKLEELSNRVNKSDESSK